ncbi:hypothetical protein BGZ61DRAFT_179297 [Ilyonectria robusta]|uniref:uncharacterized protein n=1 Tax=Ilyonectria robusta TaxID=1079257 RepID=UPI001E8E0D7A|nr:uncharacterized protein BGZ61DRAFT_179297 [Ilyonectria robusta]KAH8729327.1 hypothetical protein BGZ61DRAFT_179297 [Ilyonectria robusta]
MPVRAVCVLECVREVSLFPRPAAFRTMLPNYRPHAYHLLQDARGHPGAGRQKLSADDRSDLAASGGRGGVEGHWRIPHVCSGIDEPPPAAQNTHDLLRLRPRLFVLVSPNTPSYRSGATLSRPALPCPAVARGQWTGSPIVRIQTPPSQTTNLQQPRTRPKLTLQGINTCRQLSSRHCQALRCPMRGDDGNGAKQCLTHLPDGRSRQLDARKHTQTMRREMRRDEECCTDREPT